MPGFGKPIIRVALLKRNDPTIRHFFPAGNGKALGITQKAHVLNCLVKVDICVGEYIYIIRELSGLDEKIIWKAHSMLEHKDALGLSDEQVQAIHEIKIATKKQVIKSNADIEIIKLDIKVLLYKNPIDVETVSGLIDRKYSAKKKKAKALVLHLANLKAALSETQYLQLKEIWNSK